MEMLTCPALAGVALSILPVDPKFAGTGFGFLLSAFLVSGARTDKPWDVWQFLGPREMGDSAIPARLAIARASGLESVCFNGRRTYIGQHGGVGARGVYGGEEAALALAMAAFGAGSMAAALALPGLLDHIHDRSVMILAGRGFAALGWSLESGWRWAGCRAFWLAWVCWPWLARCNHRS